MPTYPVAGVCFAALRDARNGRREGISNGKPALNAVELAHAQGRTRDKRGEAKKAKQSKAKQSREEAKDARTRDRRLVDAYSFD